MKIDKEKVEDILLANARWKRERNGPQPYTDLEVELAAELQLALSAVPEATGPVHTKIERQEDGTARLVPTRPWQPSVSPEETATWRVGQPPKDGKAYLGYFPGRGGYVAAQCFVPIAWVGWGGGIWQNSTSGHNVHDEPTHWQPLPSPPKEAP